MCPHRIVLKDQDSESTLAIMNDMKFYLDKDILFFCVCEGYTGFHVITHIILLLVNDSYPTDELYFLQKSSRSFFYSFKYALTLLRIMNYF